MAPDGPVASTVMFPGASTFGAFAFFGSTMTLNVFGCDAFPASSVAVHDTIVVPTGKVEPDAGVQLTTGALSTTSVADEVNVATALLSVDIVSTIEMSAGTVTSGGVVSATNTS